MTMQDTTAERLILDSAGAPQAARRSPGRITTWTYRVATGLIMALMALSGVANLVRPERLLVALHHLGYPDYFSIMLGSAKLLGVVAFALPGARRLKEWAYAGFSFDLIAAFVSHTAVHNGLASQVEILAWLFVLAVSYAGHYRRTVLVDVGAARG